MAELINMPKLGFDMAEGTLVEWVKQVGDQVNEGDVVAMIETDKANVEVTSFKSGVLLKLLAEEGQSVPVGDPIAVIGGADEEIDEARLKAGAAEPEAKEKAGAEPEPAPSVEPEAQAPAAAAQKGPEEGGRRLASPVAVRMADELDIDLTRVQGSGPGGRIIKRDIESYLQEREKAPEQKPRPPISTPSYEPSGAAYTVEPLSPIRKTIGRRMAESKQQAPHFYVTMAIDMAAAMALRKQLNELVEEKISVNDLILKACALALRDFPHLNASFAGEELHIHDEINIGIAVARENGLITTVVHNCDQKSLAQVAHESAEVIGRAREGRMRPEDMIGSTFTVSNMGMFGIEDFVAIINPPNAAILAVGTIQRIPVYNEEGQVVPATQMKVTLSADHRVTDGAEAAEYLVRFKEILEQPLRLML